MLMLDPASILMLEVSQGLLLRFQTGNAGWNPASPESGWKQLQSLPGPQRFDHGVAELRGKIYVFGGATGEGAGVRNLHDAYQFDIRSGKWTKLPDLPLARRAWWAWARGFSFWEVTPKVMRLKSTSLTPHRRDSA